MIVFQNDNSVGNYNYNSVIYSPCEWGYHFHKNYELIYIYDGELDVFCGGREFTMHSGEFALILPNCIHSLHTPKKAEVWIGVFSADYVSSFDAFMSGKQNLTNVFTVDEELMPYLKKYLLTDKKSDVLNMKAMLYAVCSAYVKNAVFCGAESERDLPMKIFEYVQNNFKSDISLKTAALALGYNYQYASRVYKSVFRINFRDFLNRFRLDYAQYLLTNTNLAVTETAMNSGFGSIRTMNRCFIKEYGISPSEIHRRSVIQNQNT